MKIDINKWLFKNRNITNKTVLTINNDNIPYEEINKNDKIAFIICTQDHVLKLISRLHNFFQHHNQYHKLYNNHEY